MAEMREQEFVPGAYTIGKIYYEYLEMIALEGYKTIEGFSTSEMLLASAITGEHRLRMGKQNEERHKKAANHIKEQRAAAVIADNSNRRLAELFKELGASLGIYLSDHTAAFAEMVKRLCTSSQTRTQQHIYNLYQTEREREPLDLNLYSHELQLAPLFGVKYCEKLRVFKFRDIFLIVDHLNRNSYILTINHLDHLRSVTSWVTRLRYLWKNYRKLGSFDTDQEDVYRVNEDLLQMIAARIKDREGDPLLAREIKAVQFILFSNFHEEISEVDTGASERVATLEKEFEDTYHPQQNSNFLSYMKEADITLRAKLDVLNVFAILPPPDCWLDHIWRNVVQKGKEEHQVDRSRFDEFTKYAHSAIFAHVAYKDKKIPTHTDEWVESGSYDDRGIFVPSSVPSKSQYLEDVLKIPSYMPSKEDWGKLRISEHFEPEPIILAVEKYIQDSNNIPEGHPIHYLADCRVRYPYSNELTAAVRKQSLVGGTTDKATVHADYLSGALTGSKEVAVTVNGKAENTKDKTKTREILSASANSRLVLKQYDRNTQQVNKYIPNVDLASSGSRHSHNMNYFKNSTGYSHMSRRQRMRKELSISSDFSAFSPRQNRPATLDYHTRLSYCFKNKRMDTLKKIMKRVLVTVNSQKIYGSEMCTGGSYQGFCARQDTNLHAMAIPYVLSCMKHKLYGSKLVPAEASIKSLVTIDDAINAVKGLTLPRHDLDASKEAVVQGDVIKDFVENYKRGFKDLGYMLDNAKTIVSQFKATYLNENWYDGTQLTVTAKTAMKICPGVEERGSSTAEICQAYMGGARGAMKKGSCPLSTYSLCWYETLLALFERVPESMGWSESDVFAVLISPPESGGIGLISFQRICDMETSDSYSTAIGYVQNIIEHLNSKKSSLRNACVNLINGVFVDQFEEIKATAFLGAPRSVHHPYLMNAKGPLSSAIKKVVMDKTDDDNFKDAIKILDSSALNRELWNCLRMFSFDVALVESLDSVMPFKIYSTLLGKMTSSEAMLRMLDKGVRVKALRRSRKIDRENVVTLHDYMHKQNPNTDNILLMLKEGKGMNVVSEYRDRYYSFLKLSIHNHTAVIIMSPPSNVEPLYHGRMKQLFPTRGDTFLSSWKTYEHSNKDELKAASRTKNLYDSRHIQIVRDFPKSKGLFDSESEPFRELDSKERGLKVAAAYAKHAESMENPGYYYSEFVLALQGIFPDSKVIKQKKNMVMSVGRSLKAASRCLGTITHESYIFNNVYACADLERTTSCGIDDYISANKTMGNYVSFICICRTKLICNYAAFRTQQEADQHTFRITFKKKGFVKRELTVIQVAEALSLEDECDDYILESFRKLASAITTKATDELEELIDSSPSLTLEDTVRVRLIKAMDKRTVEATNEDGGYRSDPESLVVDIHLSLPTRKELRTMIYPPLLSFHT